MKGFDEFSVFMFWVALGVLLLAAVVAYVYLIYIQPWLMIILLMIPVGRGFWIVTRDL